MATTATRTCAQEPATSPPAALNETALAMMLRPVRLRQEELEKEICSICHSFLRYGRATRLVPCGHAFHIECVRRWLLIRGDCPMCRGLPFRQNPDVGGGREGEMVEVEGEDLWEGWQSKEKKGGRIEKKKTVFCIS